MEDRLWFLNVRGFDPFVFMAPTRAKARYENAKALKEAWNVTMKQAFKDIRYIRLARESDLSVADNGECYADYFKADTCPHEQQNLQ